VEDKRFDVLSRVLGQGASRRGALGVLAAVAGLNLDEVLAKGKSKRHGKRKGKPRTQKAPAPKCTATKTSNSACGQFCSATFGAGTTAASQCTSAATKCQGLCYQCGPGCGSTCGKTLCGQQCVDTQTDPAHCGSCPQACGNGQTCHNGSCCTPNCTGKCGGADDTRGGTCDTCCADGTSCASANACCSGLCEGRCCRQVSIGGPCEATPGYCCRDMECGAGGNCCLPSGMLCGDICHLCCSGMSTQLRQCL
jgi:hypothetical protein